MSLRDFFRGVKNIFTAPIVEFPDDTSELAEMFKIPKPVIYLASPYIRAPEENYRKTAAYAAKCLQRGEVIVSSILMFHHVQKMHNLPKETEWWLQFDYRILEACDHVRVLMLPGWQQSVGVGREIAMAKSLGKYIEYADPDN